MSIRVCDLTEIVFMSDQLLISTCSSVCDLHFILTLSYSQSMTLLLLLLCTCGLVFVDSQPTNRTVNVKNRINGYSLFLPSMFYLSGVLVLGFDAHL